MTLNVPFTPLLASIPTVQRLFPMPFIRRNAGAKSPRWPFVMNKGSVQARNLFAWYPASPAIPGQLIDMSPGTKRDLVFVTAKEPTLDTSLLGGNAVTYVNDDKGQFDAETPELNGGGMLTLTGWFTTNSDLANYGPWIADKNFVNRYTYLAHRPDLAGDFVQAFHHNYGFGGEKSADGDTVVPNGEVHHAAARFLNIQDRDVWLDGVLDHFDTVGGHGNRVGIDRIGVGSVGGAVPLNTGDGTWWDTRVYNGNMTAEIIRQMFEPDTRYDLFEEYGQRTYFDMGIPVPEDAVASEIVQPMMTIINQ